VGEPGRAAFLAVVVRDTDEFVGDVMFRWDSAEHSTAEIGYVIHPDHGGRGYATEAAGELLRLAFERLDLHRVIARVDERNPASGAVLRKLGMRQEAVLVENEWFKGSWSTEIDYGILQREWRSGASGQR
jgi:RimJ/RimL family protein N-acetyltransferase